MKTHSIAKRQGGAFLLEALVAILVISFGILGIVGLQARSLAAVGDAQYRGEAAFYAQSLAGRMWAHDPTDVVAYFATGGTGYTNWNNQVTAAGSGLPGATTDGLIHRFAIGQRRHGAHQDHVAGAQRRCAAHLRHPSRRRQQRRAMNQRHPLPRRARGFSLIDVMVGIVIALIAVLVIYQVFDVSEGIKRNATGAGDAQQNGLLSSFMMALQFSDAGANIAVAGGQPRRMPVRQRHQDHAAADPRADHRQRLGYDIRHVRRQLRCFRAHGHAHQLQLGADDRSFRGLCRAEPARLQDQRRRHHDEQRFEWRGQVRQQHRDRRQRAPTATAMSRSSTPRLRMRRCSPATRC